MGIVRRLGKAGICYMRHYPSPQTPLRDMGGRLYTCSHDHPLLLKNKQLSLFNHVKNLPLSEALEVLVI